MLLNDISVNCIRDLVWEEFKKSNKKHLVITGSRAIGKTTLLKSLIELIQNLHYGNSMHGLITKLSVDCENHKKIILKSTLQEHWQTMAVFEKEKIIVEQKKWSTVGVEYLKNVVSSKSSTIFIDEIGFIELQSKEYLKQILNAFENKIVIAVLRKMESDFHIKLKSRNDVYVVDVDDYRIRR